MKPLIAVILVFVFVAISAGFSMSSSLEECGDYEHSLKWVKNIYLPFDENIYSMSVQWPLVFTGNLRGIFVTDLSDQENPEITQLLECHYSILEKSLDVGLVRFEYDSIISLDFSDPFAPICKDTLKLDMAIWDGIRSMTIFGDRAFVTTISNLLQIVDISDLSHLRVSGSWLSSDTINDLEVCGDIAYVGDWKSLHILDISDPDNPHEIAVKDSPRVQFNKNEDLLLAINSSELEIFRLTDPAYPESILRIPSTYIEEGAVSEDVVAVGYHSTDIYPLNQLAIAQKMVTVGSGWSSEGCMRIHNDTLLKASGNIIELYELHKGRSVSGGPVLSLENQMIDWSQQGHYVYGTNWNQGFTVCSISNDGEIEIVSETDDFGQLRRLEVAGDLAFVSEYSAWRILDISNPLNPTILTQTLPIQTTATNFFPGKNQVIVTGDNWVNVYDISNLDDIILTSSTGIYYISSADMVDETLYIGVGGDNPHVNIYSVTNGSLQLNGVLDLQSRPVDMEARDGSLLINSGHYTHQLYDVSIPSSPSLSSETETWSEGNAEFVNDGIMISDKYSLRFYNTDDSMELDILGAFWHDEMEDFQVMEDGRILVWGNHKIQVVPSPCSWSEPAKKKPTKLQTIITASPNPFNPQTTLMFTLPESGFCSLDIFDLRGRLVQQLWAGNIQAGEQQFLWQGKDEEGQSVPSGIYFARLVHDGGVANQKIVLLK